MAIVSKSEVARRKGISPAMVTKLCRSGRIPVLKSGLAGGTSGVAVQFNKAKTAEKIYQAKLKRLEFEEKEGSLIAKDAVRDDAFLAANELRSRLFSIAPRAAPRCEGKTAREIERIIEDEINFALQALQESRFIKQEE